MTMTADRARELLGAGLNGHDVVAGHASRNGMTLVTTPHRWQWHKRERRQRREVKPGSRLIAAGGFLLFLLAAGLLAVSFAAQYRYVLHERHQQVPSVIEGGALDIGLIIFSLLALGLARAGKSAKIERAAVVGCAVGSAVMNFAPADSSSWRSVLAWTMPPVFLAFVVDRVVRTIQRHVLAGEEGRSPWSAIGGGVRRIARFCLLSVLYVLRFLVDRRATCAGLKQAILNATPLPEIPATEREQERRRRTPHDGRRGPTKTTRFLSLVAERHGDLASIPLDRVSQIATAIAPEVPLHPASARTALLGAVRAALPAGRGDAK